MSKQCPKCGTQMSLGASHCRAGAQWECWHCGHIEQHYSEERS